MLFAVLALFLAACNNVPDEPLVGTWEESGKSFMKVLDFHEDGTLVYYEKPGQTTGGMPDEAGEFASMHYEVIDNTLYFSGEEIYLSDGIKWDTIPYAFSSDFRIKGKMLTIDSFAYVWYFEGLQKRTYHLKLYKK